VAVRSSAVDEDGEETSFAGQYETFLNITGADAVANAVAACWRSAHSHRAGEYRRSQGMGTEPVRLAVLVQHLVPADVSAVVFSANPVTSARDEIVINASWGLGESIVGGTVTPDTYVVAKADLSVRSRRIAEKARMTVPAEGGTREVDVPRFLRAQPALTDAQAAEMAELAVRLEEATGRPVDVEAAFAGGSLHLLQCRPITTLA
jgi:pyruvate,water dikinase